MKTSVVLSTYNGGKYIIEQLDSLKNQSKKIDEVLIRDDGSKDDTVKIIDKYIKDNKLDNWRVEVNKVNLGWERNFYNLIKDAKGDYIFPCDQDDIWPLNKIELMSNCMNSHPDILLLCSDYKSLYMPGNEIKVNPQVYENKYDGSLEHLTNKKCLLLTDRPGCAECINKELLKYIDAIYMEKIPHDSLVWRVAFLLDKLYILHEPLLEFRRHGNNTSDYKARDVDTRLDMAKIYFTVAKNELRFFDKYENINGNKEFVEKCVEVYGSRIEILKNNKFFKWIKEFKNIKYYPTTKSYFADGFTILKKKLS